MASVAAVAGYFALLVFSCQNGHASNDVEYEVESRARHHFQQRAVALLNDQINTYLNVSYVYRAMVNHFNRDVVALPGLAKFFKHACHQGRGIADNMMDYVNMRGGRVELKAIDKPPRQNWRDGLHALKDALSMEHVLFDTLTRVHKMTETARHHQRHSDPHLSNVLADDYIDTQIEDIKKIADLITQIKLSRKTSPGLGEYLFDKHLEQSLGYPKADLNSFSNNQPF